MVLPCKLIEWETSVAIKISNIYFCVNFRFADDIDEDDNIRK